MADDLTRAQRVNLWIQSIAIVLAGFWALYEFVLKEQSKTLHIIPQINTRIGDVTPDDGSNSFLPIYVETVLRNSSERDAYVIGGFILVWAHKSRIRTDFFLDYEVDTETDQVLDMKYIDWSAEVDVLGTAVSLTNHELAPKEQATETLTFVIPNGDHDILEIKADFRVVDACKYIYPFQDCYEFASVFRWDAHENCPDEDNVTGTEYCIDIYYRQRGSEEWVVADDDALESFEYLEFPVTQFVVLPRAPILTSRQTSREQAGGQ